MIGSPSYIGGVFSTGERLSVPLEETWNESGDNVSCPGKAHLPNETLIGNSKTTETKETDR
jgi:hypothetical protein